MMTTTAPDTALLSKALQLGRDESPFPWQIELLKRFMRGESPPALNLPTGLGKTSVMAIWLVARAAGANVPRRLVYVVDRRAVVDQATDVALGLRTLVDGRPDIRDALGLRDDRSLPISTLRGQFVDNREWLEDPASSAIVVGTVDMIGSRLLFEGYGVSRKMRPYHAGLLGTDTLVVLDEAHLVPPFEHLLRAVETERTLHPRDGCSELVPRLRLMALTATGRGNTVGVLGLMEADAKHPVVRKRLEAAKSLQVEQLDSSTELSDVLAERAWKLMGNDEKPERVLIYSDSREVAQKTKAAVEKRAKGDKIDIDTELFVGGRRVFERQQVKSRLDELGFIAGSELVRARPAFLFATSAAEVGVDLDADHMVCDLVAWERMVQRLGRVNRRGDGDAHVIVLVGPEPENIDQLIGKDPSKRSKKEATTVERVLRTRAVTALVGRLGSRDGGKDASPGALHDLRRAAEADPGLEELLGDASTPEPLRPALTRPLVDAWSMTSLERHTGRPAIQPWLRGWIEDELPRTAVVWRTHLPVRAGGAAPRKKEIEDFFEAAPPHLSELLETETFRVVKWIAARAKSVCKPREEQETAADAARLREEDVAAFALDPDGGLRRTLTLAELERPDGKEELSSVLGGATLAIDARLAGLKDGLLDDKESGLPRTADDGESWLGEGGVGFRVRSIEASTTVAPDLNWRERFRFASAVTEDGEATRWLVVEKWRHGAATEDDRSAANPQLLDEHQSMAEARACRLAEALGLDDERAHVLVLAARLHDEGKRARRWQRAFNAPEDGVYAKTQGPLNYRLLDGYRHELGSLIRVENDGRVTALSEGERDLVLHLIAAHHGFARPVITTSGCEDDPPSVLERKAAEIALRFARLQDRWGPWGLAWWEALLRAADQQASRDNDARDLAAGGA